MRRSFLSFLILVFCGLISITGCGGYFRGSVPDVPFIGERVVALGNYNGVKEALLNGHRSHALKLLRSQYNDIEMNDMIYRHASLALDQWGGEPGQDGMIGNFRDRAKAEGWEIIPELSVDASGFSYLLTLKKNGYVLALLGLDDIFALIPENPGASVDVAERRWNCERTEKPTRMDIGPCPVGGFVPVYVFSNLVDRDRAYSFSGLSDRDLTTQLLGGKERMKRYPEDTMRRAPTWEELTVLSKSAESSADTASE